MKPIDEMGTGLSRRSLLTRTAVAGAGVTAMGAALAACGDSGSASAGDGEQKSFTFAYPQSGGTERFLRVVRKGVEAAAADLGVSVKVTATKKFDQVEQGRLVRAAAASKPDGIITGVWDGDIMREPIMSAVDAGIPVVIMDSGQEFADEFGALTFVGPDNSADAVKVGERLKEEGATNVLAINHQVGSLPLDIRLDGVEKGYGGTMRTIGVNGADPIAARNRIRAALQETDFDAVLGLGQPSGEPALQALEDTGKAGKVIFGTYDFSLPLLAGVQGGDVTFVVDQQQYLEGYFSVVVLAQFNQYEFEPPSVLPTASGFIAKDNADAVVQQAKELVR